MKDTYIMLMICFLAVALDLQPSSKSELLYNNDVIICKLKNQ